MAGNVSCVTSAPLSFDKAVDIPVLTQDKVLFSPNADNVFDFINASYEIDKYAQVDVKVFKLIENQNTPPVLDTTPVKTIISGQTYLSGREYT
ncbi:MAG: hypothetical protein LAN62_00780, partial [Acidobacteriia bacterium]|nr:hypothetical protein [Terriglobia bacterium]